MSQSMHMEIENTSCAPLEPRKELKMGSTILDCFTKLVKDNVRERLDGGIALLRHMSQKKVEETESKELNYALTRLVRGLGSSRTLSRKGFYTTLTAYLQTNSDTCMDDLLKIMETELRPVNSNTKSENADIYMGRILLCGALIRSKLLLQCKCEEQQKIFEILFFAGQQRSHLSFISIFFLADFLEQSDTKSLKIGIWPLLKKELGKAWEKQTLDTFYILLIMNEKFPTLVGSKFLKEHLGHEDIINAEHMKELLKLLTDLPRIVYCRHPVFKLFCEKIVSSELLVEFWSGIDQRFVKPSKSIEHLGLELFKHLLMNIKDKTLIPSLLTANFLHHMIRRFTSCKKNRRDQISITFKSILSELISVMSDKDIKAKTQVGVLKKLILYPGDIMIEKVTGTKIIQLLTANLNVDGVKKLSKLYHEIVSNAKPKEKKGNNTEAWTNMARIYVAQLLTRLLGHPAVSTEHKWRLDQLKFLFNLGLCESSNVGVELAPQFKECFYRALDHKLPKLSDLRTILSELIHHLNDELFVKKTSTLRTPLTEAATEAWSAMINFITKLEGAAKNEQAMYIFYTMDLHMGLQLFSEPEMAISAIKEIHSCSERLNKYKPKKGKKNGNENIEDEPEWVEVIVDLLLSLLSRNSHLLRSMVHCVFPHICAVSTAASIHQILSVLDPKNDKSPLVSKNDEVSGDSSNNEDSDSSDEDESDEEVKYSNEVSLDNVKEKNDEDEDEEDSDDDSDKDEDDDEDEDETVTDRLRLAVRQALGDASVQTDDEDIDVDQIDEAQGKRLDESLAAAFRILRENRQTQSKKQEKTAQLLTHFRVRVIDLLEIYIDSGPSMALALDMLVPLFGLLEFCIKDPHQKPLENRVRTCLKKLSAVKRFKDTEGVDAQLLTDVSKLLMEKGERSTAVCQEMGDKLAECATFLIRCVQQADLAVETLVQIYGENLTAFFKKRDCVLPASLFKNALKLVWVGNWQLAPLLVDFAFDDTIRSFRRSQALEFLTIFYRNNRLIKNEENNSIRLTMEKKLYANSLNLLQELTSSFKTPHEDSTNEKNSLVGKEVRQKFVCLLMTLLHVVYFQHLPDAWDWKSIAVAISEYRTNVSLSNDARSAYIKLATMINAPVNITTKKNEWTKPALSNRTKSNGENGLSEVETDSKTEENGMSGKNSKKEIKKKLKIRSKKKDKQKLKKIARELRAKAMSEGLESFDFSTAKFENGNATDVLIENGVAASETNTNEKTKKRPIQEEGTTPSETKKKKKNLDNKN
ncbi:myb-binding protein 1A [Venturia canescens]|uniref:myb-binding protein 1A n=1 Tax=Venturia canescens TaxID=32260 RepID=UPI001C9BD851|nr:myb-binding protein 1A [Venturia canescens]